MKCGCRRSDDEHRADDQHVHDKDHSEGKKAPVLINVRLFATNHPDREGEMKHPRESN